VNGKKSIIANIEDGMKEIPVAWAAARRNLSTAVKSNAFPSSHGGRLLNYSFARPRRNVNISWCITNDAATSTNIQNLKVVLADVIPSKK
jgi:hypothetical protein